MPWFEFDLCDGKKPVGFSLKPDDSARFIKFMAECHGYKEALADRNREAREAHKLLREFYQLCLDGRVALKHGAGGGIWTLPDRVKHFLDSASASGVRQVIE